MFERIAGMMASVESEGFCASNQPWLTVPTGNFVEGFQNVSSVLANGSSKQNNQRPSTGHQHCFCPCQATGFGSTHLREVKCQHRLKQSVRLHQGSLHLEPNHCCNYHWDSCSLGLVLGVIVSNPRSPESQLQALDP